MNIVKIDEDLNISIVPFPDGSITEQNAALKKLIGNNCNTLEHVMPVRLYTELKVPRNNSYNGDFRTVSMLIDEEGLVKDEEIQPNLVASYLYNSFDPHINVVPIMGNILLVGEYFRNSGIDFGGIPENVLANLTDKLNNLATKIKKICSYTEGVID